MQHNVVHLKVFFPVLGEQDCDPTLTLYLLQNMVSMGREHDLRPTILV